MTTIRCIITLSVLIAIPATADEVSPAVLRSAIQKGLAMLEQTSPAFIKKGGCNSCHNQMLPAAAQAFVRTRGVTTGPDIAQLAPELSEATTERIIEYQTLGANSLGYELFSYGMRRVPPTPRIRALVHVLANLQQPQGKWSTTGNRPPLSFDDFTTTAYAVYSLNQYAPPAQRAAYDARLARARSWLLEAKPQTTQERAFHVLGLAWSKAGREAIARAVGGLVPLQKKDGGWSQLPGLPSDAYATGLALWAIAEAGAEPSHPAYREGIRYLIETQAADGTWHVKTRSMPFQPYFESGYPYGHDQWISSAGAAYATIALASALPAGR